MPGGEHVRQPGGEHVGSRAEQRRGRPFSAPRFSTHNRAPFGSAGDLGWPPARAPPAARFGDRMPGLPMSHGGLNRPWMVALPVFRSPTSPSTDGNGHRNNSPRGPRRASTSGGYADKPRGRCGIWDSIRTFASEPGGGSDTGPNAATMPREAPLLGTTPPPPGRQATRRCSPPWRHADARDMGRQVRIKAPGKPVGPLCAKGPLRGAQVVRGG